jgi:membrane fusion protein, multidrug efflux system
VPVAPRRLSHRRPLALLAGVALIAAIVVGIRYLRYALTHESTDDAFVAAHTVAISAKVANYVSRVLIDDNQHVNKGDLLVALDPRDFEARLAQAKANLAAANLQAAQKTEQAAADNLRQVESQVDEAQAGLASAKAAPQQVAYSRAQTQQVAAQIAQRQAADHAAELDLSYTKIDAPVAGRITRKSVEPGDYVEVGQTLFLIVPASAKELSSQGPSWRRPLMKKVGVCGRCRNT